MTIEQLVFACMANENRWVDLNGRVIGVCFPWNRPTIAPAFCYTPSDEEPWGISHSPKVSLMEFTHVEAFGEAALTYYLVVANTLTQAGISLSVDLPTEYSHND